MSEGRIDPARDVVAVVVAFAPAQDRFAEVLAAAGEQCAAVIVVDNAEGAGLETIRWSDALERVDMGGNAGVAAAQNAGLRRAFALGATYALLLDHDSVPGQGMVASLVAAFDGLVAAGEQVATVGANYRDPRRPRATPFIRVSGWRMHRLDNRDPAAIHAVSYVISSGSLVSASAFRDVGAMNEQLFIDYVDVEWGLRAGRLGWRSFGVCGALLDHELGDAPLTILGHSFPLRGPTRHYYMVRNGLWLILRGSLPMGWKFVEGWRLARRALAYALLAPNRANHVRSMLRGFRDGCAGRLGAMRPQLS